LIAYTPDNAPTGVRDWFRYSTQRSRPIQLEAGRRYYVEALHKEDSASDHLAVAWQIPRDDFFLILSTDAATNVVEASEANNTIAIPIKTLTTDLAPGTPQGPPSAFPGQNIEIRWSATNRGPDQAVAPWTDRVYLSSDNRYSADDIQFVSALRDSDLVSTGSYSLSVFVGLPSVPAGNYFLILRADADGTLSETNELNNETASPITVSSGVGVPTGLRASPGNGQATLTWGAVATATNYNLYYGTNALLSKATGVKLASVTSPYIHTGLVNGRTYYYFVTAEFAGGSESAPSAIVSVQPAASGTATDLTPSSLRGPAQAAPRQRVEVSWTVRNAGNADALPGWTDFVFLSADATWDAADQSLTSAGRSQALWVGDTYTLTTVFDVPVVSAGNYFLVLRSDYYNNLAEGNEANNEISIPFQVVAPDLAAVSIRAPSALSVGQSVELAWTVQNLGAGAAVPSWSDQLFLSADATWDITDRSIATVSHDTALSPGANYSVVTTISLPAVPAGDWYLVLRTDHGGALYEVTETNNAVAVPLTVVAPDLAPTALSAPAAGGIRQPIGLGWSVRNQGNSDAIGSWTDRVYLSRDNVVDPTDQVLLDLTRSLPLRAGDAYSVSQTV